MSEADADSQSDADADSQHPRPSVFLSYASEDRKTAQSLRDALLEYGLDVWYDESELGGGEAWDQKIRRQIRECDYFMPVVSSHTEARHEGYFRREWRLAVERTLDMADDHLFLLPVLIDDIEQTACRVPEKFLTVQWLKLPGGQPTRALESLCRRIAAGAVAAPPPPRKSAAARRQSTPAASLMPSRPTFPQDQPGRRPRFWAEVVVWAFRTVWLRLRGLPRWVQWTAGVFVTISLLSQFDSSSERDSADITPAKIEKLKAISQQFQTGVNKGDLLKLGTAIAKEFSDDSDEATDRRPLLAIAFTAPAGDASAAQLADSTFAMAYGMVAIAHHGQVGLAKEPLASRDLGAALERGRANHSAYVLCGSVGKSDSGQALTVTIASVSDGSVLWSKSYAAAGADPAKIAADVGANIPPLEST